MKTLARIATALERIAATLERLHAMQTHVPPAPRQWMRQPCLACYGVHGENVPCPWMVVS